MTTSTVPWWVISTSSYNGKPWQAVSFQGTKQQAQSASANTGGILAGPFPDDAHAVTWGQKWSKTTHHAFTDDPGTLPPVIPNPVQDINGFLSDITSANLWIRVAKIAIGGAILIVGLAKLTGTDQKLGNAVSSGVKYAPLL
jgi:hypothetical protein